MEPTGEPFADGRYLLQSQIGTGGFAAVYQALDTTLMVERAIKILTVEGARRDSVRSRLRAEARAMARLHHPNVLQVYDIGTDGDRDYVVMDLAPGGSLADHLRQRGPMPVERAVGCALQILSALAAAHAEGIVHRDVKPQNVLIDRAGSALLADFGIALVSQDTSRSTKSGIAMGSLSFMAPEQRLDARTVGPSADLYATGATLYTLVTCGNPVDLFTARQDSERWDGVPVLLRPVLYRATRFEIDDRYQTAREMARDLVQVLVAVGGTVPTPRPASDYESFPEPAPSLQTHPGAGRGSLEEATRDAIGFLMGTEDVQSVLVEVQEAALREGTGPRVSGPTLSPTTKEHTDGGYSPPIPVVADEVAPRRWWVILAAVLVASIGLGGWVLWARLGERPRPEQVGVVPDPVPVASVPEPTATLEPGVEAVASVESVPDQADDPTASEVEQLRQEPVGTSERDPDRPVVAAIGEPPLGTWEGSFNARPFTLVLAGTPEAITGEAIVRLSTKESRHSIAGSFDPVERLLLFEDLDQQHDSGSYRAILTADLTGLEGSWERRGGGSVVPFSASRRP